MKFVLSTEALTFRKILDFTGAASARVAAQTLADAVREPVQLRFDDVGENPLVQPGMQPEELATEKFEPEPLAATLVSVTPNTGGTAGGTDITIRGTGFIDGTTFTIGGTPVTALDIVSPELATAKAPAGTAGAKSLVASVPTSGAPKTTTLPNAFTYA